MEEKNAKAGIEKSGKPLSGQTAAARGCVREIAVMPGKAVCETAGLKHETNFPAEEHPIALGADEGNPEWQEIFSEFGKKMFF